ncbi:MAG TPA: hypothetical protein VFI22_16310 [Thermomicrobiales bacterium]|nr:hypothetical protein [Thermomicrobiales bacterium]
MTVLFAKVLAFPFAVVGIALMLLGTMPALAAGPADDPANDPAVSGVRAATDRFHDLIAAKTDGYALLEDAAGIACIADPTAGAMGVHYANGELVSGGKVDPLKPQALVYERLADGTLRLAAVEYVVLQEGWDAAHATPPTLFGQEFTLTPAGNRFGLPAYYSLHAWVWKANPSGEFAMWNPDVSCPQPCTTG